MDIELMGWIGEEMSDEEIIAMIDEIEAEEMLVWNLKITQ